VLRKPQVPAAFGRSVKTLPGGLGFYKMVNALAGYDLTISAGDKPRAEFHAWVTQYFKRYCYQLEKGAETGYMHYQFRGSLKTKMRWDTLQKRMAAAGFEGKISITSGGVFELGDEFYQMKKDHTYVEGPWTDRDIDTEDEFSPGFIPYDFRGSMKMNCIQEDLWDYIQTPPNRREVLCVVGPGNIGKSYFASWLDIHKHGHYVSYFTEAKSLMEECYASEWRRAYLIDLPKALSHKAENEVYGAIEQLKTGCVCDRRYKYKKRWLNPAHVIVFTNRIPDANLLSSDRWKIMEISEERAVQARTGLYEVEGAPL